MAQKSRFWQIIMILAFIAFSKCVTHPSLPLKVPLLTPMAKEIYYSKYEGSWLKKLYFIPDCDIVQLMYPTCLPHLSKMGQSF